MTGVFILYLDESGVPEVHPGQTSHFVFLGVAIHEGTWFALDRQVRDLKGDYALGDPRDLELHAAWLIRPYPEQRRIAGFGTMDRPQRRAAMLERRAARESTMDGRSKRHRESWRQYVKNTDATAHLTAEERLTLYYRALTIAGKYRRGLHLFGEAIDKDALPDGVDPVEQAFTQIVSRFEAFLQTQSSREWGLIAADRDEQKAARLERMLARFQQSGTAWRDIDRVIEAPFFFDSAASAGVQVTDVCAYALRRYVELAEDQPFQIIFPKFYRSNGRLHGLRHYTRRGCDCVICTERGFS